MIDLSQQEANLLIDIEKLLTNPRALKLPKPGKKELSDLTCKDQKEQFVCSVYKSNKNSNNVNYLILYQGGTTLLRVDSGHGIHINPDGAIIPAYTPHIHIYREGYHDSYAHDLPSSFQNSTDITQTILDFLRYSKVINVNLVQICSQGGVF